MIGGHSAEGERNSGHLKQVRASGKRRRGGKDDDDDDDGKDDAEVGERERGRVGLLFGLYTSPLRWGSERKLL